MEDTKPITAFRFIAALHVMILHESLDHIDGAPTLLNTLLDRTAAVSFFFLISGLLLTYFHWDKPLQPQWVKRFLHSRASRVLPLYYIGFLLFLPIFIGRVVFQADGDVWVGVRGFLANLFLLQSWFPATPEPFYINRPGWTIGTFLFFYAMFPWVKAVLKRLPTWVLAALFWAFFAAAMALVWLFENRWGIDGTDLEWLHKHPLVRWPEYLMGMCLGGLLARGRLRSRIWTAAPTFAVSGLVAAALFVFLPQPLDNYIHNGLLMPLFALVVISSATTTTRFSRWFHAPSLQRLGAASFTFYILHLPFANYLSGAFYALFGDTPRFTWEFFLLDLVLLVPLSLWVYERVEARARTAWMARVDGHRRVSNEV